MLSSLICFIQYIKLHAEGEAVDAAQLRMARAALNLGVHKLADLVGVEANTISSIANDRFSSPRGGKRPESIRKLRTWLEDYVIFIDAKPGEHGSGVLLKEGIAIDKIGKNGVSSDGVEEGQISASWQQEGWGDVPDGIVVSVQFGAQ
jgi:transcriptional regulator with XRE-family HTH domain